MKQTKKSITKKLLGATLHIAINYDTEGLVDSYDIVKLIDGKTSIMTNEEHNLLDEWIEKQISKGEI